MVVVRRQTSSYGRRLARRIAIGGVVGVLVVFLWFQGARCDREYRNRLFGSADLYAALVYFAEDHGGRLPESEAELRGCDFVKVCADGAWIVTRKNGSECWLEVHEWPIHDVPGFQVAWGADIQSLQPTEYGGVASAAGEEVFLLRAGGNHRLWIARSRRLTRSLYDISMRVSAEAGQ